MPTRALLRVSTAVVTMLTLVVCVVCTLQTTQFACADGTTQVMYRLYNPNSGEHFYTADVSERDAVAAAGWSYEGEGWTAPTASSMPVYRLYSGTDHHYCTGEGEKDALVAAGWSYEGIGWYSDDAKGVPLYRQFNPNVDPTAPVNNSGSHNYTTSLDEHNYLVSIGWNDEGIGWYGVDTNTGTTVPMEPAKQPNPAGDFEYAVGNYWTYDEVHTESVAGLANTDGNYKKNKYGCGFTCSWDDGRDGCTGIDAGYGVYVTGITRKVQDVVVPDEIDGIPVVFVSLPAEYDEYYDDFESYSLRTDEDELQACATYVDDDAYITSIDVSQCQSLKYMECEYNGIDYPVEFGTINNLTEVKITGLGKNTRMDMSKQTRLECIKLPMTSSLEEFKLSNYIDTSACNLKCLDMWGYSGPSKIDLSYAAKLEEFSAGYSSPMYDGCTFHLTLDNLNLIGCTALKNVAIRRAELTSFDVSQFPNLTYLDLSGNPIEDRTALDAWAAQPGHELML